MNADSLVRKLENLVKIVDTGEKRIIISTVCLKKREYTGG